ncbi:MAG: thiamine-phosphate kinase, partial [Lentisphaerota bacterium]
MNENEFLKKVIPLFKQSSDVIVGPGDDCAVLKIDGNENEYLLYAVDQVVSDVHYLFESDDPELVGRKLVKRNISDIAAMGGEPFSAVITGAVSSNFQRLEKIYKGIAKEAELWNMSVCGGDFSSVKPKNLEVFTLSILGKVRKEKLCLRSNAREGDYLFATGKFGNSFNSRHHLTFTPRLEESKFLSGSYTNAMMDVSDGLLMDLKRFAEASKVTVSLFTDEILLRDGTESI